MNQGKKQVQALRKYMLSIQCGPENVSNTTLPEVQTLSSGHQTQLVDKTQPAHVS